MDPSKKYHPSTLEILNTVHRLPSVDVWSVQKGKKGRGGARRRLAVERWPGGDKTAAGGQVVHKVKLQEGKRRLTSRSSASNVQSPLPLELHEEGLLQPADVLDISRLPPSTPPPDLSTFQEFDTVCESLEQTKEALLNVQFPSLRTEGAPQLLRDMEKYIHTELSGLNTKLRAKVSPTQQELSKYMEDRLCVFKDCSRQFVNQFKTYGGMLNQVFKEYERYARDMRRLKVNALREAGAARREREAALRSSDEAVVQLQHMETKVKSDIEGLYASVSEGRSYFELQSACQEYAKKLEEEQKQNRDLTDKVATTSRLKIEFDRTIQAIEETFRIISDEKNIKIYELEKAAAAYKEDAEAKLEGLRKESETLTEAKEDLVSENKVLQAHVQILKDRVRATEARNTELQEEAKDLENELGRLEASLTNADGEYLPGTYQSRTRMLIEDTCATITVLGEASQYDNLEELLHAVIDAWVLTNNS